VFHPLAAGEINRLAAGAPIFVPGGMEANTEMWFLTISLPPGTDLDKWRGADS
jgi:hypothetical protein